MICPECGSKKIKMYRTNYYCTNCTRTGREEDFLDDRQTDRRV